ncbi:hypothetical protein [Propionibacterium acidifaciens]|uniref:Uncharacterized protein n=1 Tax=Propionibacterium acidifaciens F0233 TaxID=553198 RepID=U2Q6N9_9ACTN|nr:hypothetical protein [Propionibacterium acidifaciens]ERK52021.1 hypothetical protein HMPREF0682_0859 [Propionibacterium acidifaciens F0233]
MSMSHDKKIAYPVTGRWWGDPDAEPVPAPAPDENGEIHYQPYSVTIPWEEAWRLNRDVLLADARAVEAGEGIGDSDESNWLTYGVTFVCQFVGALTLACSMLTDLGRRMRAAVDSGEPVLVPDWLAEQGAGLTPEQLPHLVATVLGQRLVTESQEQSEVAARAYAMLTVRAAIAGDHHEFDELVNEQAEPEWLVPGLQDACIAVAVSCAGIGWGEELAPSRVIEMTEYSWTGEQAVGMLQR